MSEHEFCFGETCCSDAPEFHAGDRVQVRGNIEGQNQATIIEGPRDIPQLFGRTQTKYLITLDHNRYTDADGNIKQVNQWCNAEYLTRLDACPACGEVVAEGVPHMEPTR